MNINPKTTRTILAILAAAVVVILTFNVLTRQYDDPARQLIGTGDCGAEALGTVALAAGNDSGLTVNFGS